jgi:hypothetical protein
VFLKWLKLRVESDFLMLRHDDAPLVNISTNWNIHITGFPCDPVRGHERCFFVNIRVGSPAHLNGGYDQAFGSSRDDTTACEEFICQNRQMPNPNILSYVYPGIRHIKNSAKFHTSSTNHFDFMGENVKTF